MEEDDLVVRKDGVVGAGLEVGVGMVHGWMEVGEWLVGIWYWRIWWILVAARTGDVRGEEGKVGKEGYQAVLSRGMKVSDAW